MTHASAKTKRSDALNKTNGRSVVMNISLSPKLKQFVDQKVKDGFYQDPGEVVQDALRRLQAQSPRATNTGPADAMDVESEMIMVLLEAVREAKADLQAMMAEVKANNAAKQKLREIIAKVNKDISRNISRQEPGVPLIFAPDGIGSEKAYHQVAIPVPDAAANGGVTFVRTNLFDSRVDSVCVLRAIREGLEGKLDSMSEMSELTMIRLQMLMERRSKLLATLSNVMKKISTNQDALVQNLK